MSLKKVEGEHEDEAFLQCTSDEVGSGEICEGTVFAVGVNEDGKQVITCDNCGEDYELAYVINILNGRET